ncbi:MAG: chorismate synthase [Bacteroidia bacterium]|nr:chorismate synthase [Bacteroidia bacterium]
MSNSLGTIFKITSFGESHGPSVGIVIDGCPAGLYIDEDYINSRLAKRRPGQSAITTQRKESDNCNIISGVFENTSTGAPICILIENNDQRSVDYDELKNIIRPGHADYTYNQKYGIRDYKGGGRSSARITAGWVAAGAIAELLLKHKFPELSINAYVSQVYNLAMTKPHIFKPEDIDSNIVRCPDKELAKKIEALILKTKEEGDSVGGIISCNVEGCPAGLGEPVFNKLQSALGKAMLSINAVKGVQFGDGFDSASKKGSESNDSFLAGSLKNITETNSSGGMLGGISNGMPLFFEVAFKPASTIALPQNTVDSSGNPVILKSQGRHDPCVVPRAVPIVEAMTAIVLADMHLMSYSNHI